MKENLLDRKIEATQHRLLKLKNCTEGSPEENQVVLSLALEELSITLEELWVVAEELQRQNGALANEHQRYQELFEFAPDGYVVTDPTGIIQEANSGAAILLGVSKPFLLGKPLSVYVEKTERHEFRTRMKQLYSTSQIGNWTVTMQPRGHRFFPAELSVAAVEDSRGQLIGLRWLIRDITLAKRLKEEQKQYESTRQALAKEKELNALKNQFISMVSHEFRTPLTAIKLSAELLSHITISSNEQKRDQYLHTIHKSIKYLVQILEDIFSFEKTDIKTFRVNPLLLDLENLVVPKM